MSTAPAQPALADMQALLALLEQGRMAEGERAALDLTERFPDHGFGWKLLGIMLKAQGKPGPALQAMHRAAQLLPQDDQALSNFGAALAEANQLQAAEALQRQALQINPHSVQANDNLGIALCRQDRLEEAELFHRRALQCDPQYAQGHNNLGSVLNDLGRIDEAIACYRRALELDPDCAQAHWNLGMCLLQQGEFAGGWREYEWRWQTDGFQRERQAFLQPQWLGQESLQGKSILLHAEQGLGDTIQFCRYASLLADKGATVILQAPATLLPLLARLNGVVRVVTCDEQPPPTDFHCPLLSLPLACGTEFGKIPAQVPYLFADPALVSGWSGRLGPTELPRVGIAWSGNPLHRHDTRRSIALADFIDIVKDGAQHCCLQNEYGAADRALLEQHPALVALPEYLCNFADTAALIELMDLVITVDTAVAHLAAAMGKPVWLLLPFQADWRWMTKRHDSPWYPSARLFRQPKRGDWHSVLDDIRRELAQWQEDRK